MKSVAGQLKLELAQYRDLAAFAKLASDLDKATQNQLARGEKLTELLKQPQYQPQPVEEQVAIIYAATNGFAADVPTDRLAGWASALIDFLRSEHSDILTAIAQSGALSDDVRKKLDAALTDFNKSF
jgi:F-type H+-transporting ATPase subunit alpha